MIKNLRVRMKLVLAFALMVIILIATGILAMLFNGSIVESSRNVCERLVPLGDAAMEIKIASAQANLLLKKLLSGSPEEKVEEVWKHFNQALWFADVILKGGENTHVKFLATTDAGVKKKIEEVKKLLGEVILTAKERYKLKDLIGSGSEVNKEFDSLYVNLQKRLDSIAGVLGDRYVKGRGQASNKTREDLGLISALRKIDDSRYLLANGHLFFERLLAGDASVKMDEIETQFKRAKDNISNISSRLRKQTSESLGQDFDKFSAAAQQRFQSNRKNIADAEQADAKFDRLFQSFSKLTEEAEVLINRDIREGLKNVQDMEAKALWFIIAICAAGLLIALVLVTLIGRAIAVPLKECVEMADNMAEGDLTRLITINQKDEVGHLAESLNQMALNTRDIIDKIKTSSSKLDMTTDEIATGSNDLASRTNQQAASLTETSTTVEEFTTILKANSQNSEDAKQTIEDFNLEVQAKKELISNVTATMDEIRDSGQRIGNFVSVINDISFQTNLLALNAAVEAARAGDAGRGFAVVAAEVRNLAQKTAESSKSIQEIIVQNVESTEKGSELITQTSEFFETIVKTLGQMAQIVQEIATGSKEQSTGVEQINQAILELEKVVTQNAKLVETFAESSESLRKGADEMVQLAGHFKTEAGEKTVSKVKTAMSDKTPAKPAPDKRKTTPIIPDHTGKFRDKPVASAGGGSDEDFFAGDDDGFEEF